MDSSFNMCRLITRLLPLLLFFYLILLTSCFSSFPVHLRCRDDERFALLQFKESLIISTNSCYYNSFGYSKFESWKLHQGERGDCCSWDGVECDEETNHVISLDLSDSCLFGSINSNSSLFSLFHLQRLNLAYNDFNSSQIPSEVGHLSSLTNLNLSSSRFSGQIPPQISNLSALVSLDLSENSGLKLHKPINLRGLVQHLTNLKELHLSYVNISSKVPDLLAKFSSLESLRLSYCTLRGQFPIGIFQLPNIKILDLSGNSDLKGYLPPFQLGSPLLLLKLDSTNFMGELPSSIGNLANLEKLSIYSCNFTGQLPSSLSNLTKLTDLALSNNKFNVTNSSSLSWISKLSELTDLSLYSVNLNGDIPSSFLNLTQLSSLDLGYNQLTGQIPSWLMNITYLDTLYIDHNHLNGQIPSSLIYQTKIHELYLSYNQLSGEIPSQINNKSEIQLLELASNKLQGSIPSTLSTLKNLETLNLYSNNLDGTVDINIFFQLKNLRTLMLSFNNLWLLSPNNTNANNIPNFRTLGLASCNLSKFPSFLRSQSELQFLDLSSNNIHSPIPWWIWNTSTYYFGYMNLSHNKLTGFEEAPLVWQWAYLGILDLQSNMLEGSLSFPSTWRNECYLRFINLGHNRLTGQVPRWLANCSMLEFINLGENQFNDSFPSWLGNLPKLRVLVLRSNGFYGALGKTRTANFPELQIIDLSQNKLNGNLPIAYFEIWNAMKIVDASRMTYMGKNNGIDGFPTFTYDSYFYSIKMNNKGSELEYLKIPSTFAAIDFSFNKFEGVIPNVVGNLTGIYLLNLSNNILTGHIPSSVANMKELECLDLSGNQLSGEIPSQLTKLTSLSSFNVSFNNLSGPIPNGNQFETFESKAYEGNIGLCGAPLNKKCENFEGLPSTPSTSKEDENEEESRSLFKFNWMIVLMGYGSGLVIGVVAGNEFYKRKYDRLLRTFG